MKAKVLTKQPQYSKTIELTFEDEKEAIMFYLAINHSYVLNAIKKTVDKNDEIVNIFQKIRDALKDVVYDDYWDKFEREVEQEFAKHSKSK